MFSLAAVILTRSTLRDVDEKRLSGTFSRGNVASATRSGQGRLRKELHGAAAGRQQLIVQDRP